MFLNQPILTAFIFALTLASSIPARAQVQQQQQQELGRLTELNCGQMAAAQGWKEETARMVCGDAVISAQPIHCVVYAQTHTDWNLNGPDWPHAGWLCRSAISATEPVECAKKARALGWQWPEVVDVCQGVVSADARLGCIQEKILHSNLSWTQLVNACK